MFRGSNSVPFDKKIYLSSPTMHGNELEYIEDAYNTNWMSTVGANIDEAERLVGEKIGRKNAVAVTNGTAALHLAVKIAGVKSGTKVFCSDLTFIASVNPVVYEGGIPIFIDSEYQTWNMDPAALERAFEKHPDVKHVIVVNLFGTPCQYDKLREICNRHGAVMIEDAAESLGAEYGGVKAGNFGDISIISFNGNKIITGSSGGMVLTDNDEFAEKVKKWSTQSRDAAPWYQHSELGYNYRMSNIIAGVIRGQMPYLDEHISSKKAIYERYKESFKDLPLKMNPYLPDSKPNYWLSCITVEPEAMCEQVRTDSGYTYKKEHGKTCPMEILEAIKSINAEGRPIWKPMHMQPLFKNNSSFLTDAGVGSDLFNRGLCLPSDNKMTEAQQNAIIEVVRSCFD